jgi:hypothetical protein
MLFIHHGSGVLRALADLMEGKTLVKPPYKDLKTDQVKELVKAYSQVWPHNNPLLVAGPLDEANPQTLDILLKRIEEPFPNAPELILWAGDYGSVPETIRSRCGERFHYQPQPQHPLYEDARVLYDAICGSNLVLVLDSLKKIVKGQHRAFLEAYVEVLVDEGDVDKYDADLKRVLKRPLLRKVCVYGYFLGVKNLDQQ